MSWRDLLVIVRRSPRATALKQAMFPDEASWGLTEQLLAGLYDNTAWLVWSKTKDGAANRNRPDRLVRPGVEPSKDVKQIGSDPVSIEEMDAWLAWEIPEPQPERQPRDARGRFVART